MAVDRIEIISSTDEEEGFQRGPEVLQIQNDNNPEGINPTVEENEEVPEDLEENDENEKPHNGAVEDDSDVHSILFRLLILLCLLTYLLTLSLFLVRLLSHLFRAVDQCRSTQTLFPPVWSFIWTSLHRSLARRWENKMPTMQCTSQTSRHSSSLL